MAVGAFEAARSGLAARLGSGYAPVIAGSALLIFGICVAAWSRTRPRERPMLLGLAAGNALLGLIVCTSALTNGHRSPRADNVVIALLIIGALLFNALPLFGAVIATKRIRDAADAELR